MIRMDALSRAGGLLPAKYLRHALIQRIFYCKNASKPSVHFVGVDVGTTSARAALVTSEGKVKKQFVKDIKMWTPENDYYEQSSEDIWSAVCECVKNVTEEVSKKEVVGLSFDATCSLVILGENGEPLSVSKTDNEEQNIILWMDHRAQEEADAINATKHPLLSFVGGQVSLEMQMPKLLWLKKNIQPTWANMWRAFDLPDFLTWRSTGIDTRSLCSVVCKWNYDANKMQWSDEFLKKIGLEDLKKNNYEIIGSAILQPGQPVGEGLSQQAAEELNLLPGTKVGTSLIDAHAGALGMFGCRGDAAGKPVDIQDKMALICGTSTCHMSLTKEPCNAPGVWGPYKSVIIPNYYLNEGGQSVAGGLLDHIITTHPYYKNLKAQLPQKEFIYAHLNCVLEKMASDRGLDEASFLTQDLHVWPDYHGNRSPIADSTLRGMISGLGMSTDEEALALQYLAFVQALAYGTRHIIENLYQYKRKPFSTLLCCGGLARNPLYVQSHADICQLPVVIPHEQEMVLVGTAMLGACAAKVYGSLEEASKAMGGKGETLPPNKELKDYHDAKYNIFLRMLKDQLAYKELMGELSC